MITSVLLILPLFGLSQPIQVAIDPLAWRLIRMLRRKERLPGASSI